MNDVKKGVEKGKRCAALVARRCAAVVALALPLLVAKGEVRTSQSITLSPGWNAVYIEVSPEATPDEVFGSWPVESVGIYDPAAFLATRQFSGDWSSQGLPARSILMWRRDFPELTQMAAIPPGVVAVAYNTNATTSVIVTGVPAAPRITWHKTDTNMVQNVFGLSLQRGESVSPYQYLEGFTGIGSTTKLYKLSGTDPEGATLTPVSNTAKSSDGAAFFASSTVQSDWSGVLNVSPMTGIDYGADESRATFTIRNDGVSSRMVAVDLVTESAWSDGVELHRHSIYLRDAAVARTNAVWSACSDETERVAQKSLAPGETWNLELGIDRRDFDTGAKGRVFGALLRVTDVDGGSKMRVDVPLRGETSGGRGVAGAWQAGLWVAEVALHRIIAPNSDVETETGGTAKLRLPIHIDSNGTIRLLQRVTLAGETDASDNFRYRIYAGSATVPSTACQVSRISAVCLPTEIPVVQSTSGGIASGPVVFEFTVSEGGATSLLRHPLHPSHDGLRWDFTTPAPSGDDINNYKFDVKPETFSVMNRIELTLDDLNGGETAWNPEGVKRGTCRWSFGNLMRQGDITLVGEMTISRISTEAELVLERSF